MINFNQAYYLLPRKVLSDIFFVGGKFYANEFGVRWFAKNVSPYIDYKTFVIGRGFGNLQNELEQYKNVKILGEVDILSNWYMNAEYVIAPIFEGSGMKTKVAEALMYGKKIIATTSALIGYENLPDDSYYVCNTKKNLLNYFLFCIVKFLKNSITTSEKFI